jgi:hypothetical protein
MGGLRTCLVHASVDDPYSTCKRRRTDGKTVPVAAMVALQLLFHHRPGSQLGLPCTGSTQGLLLRAKIVAGKLVPVGKETDRKWEHGGDPSMLDSQVHVYEKQTKMVVADASERKRWSAIGVRRLMRESKLSQAPVSNAIKGKPVRRQTLSTLRQAAAGIQPE